jgi:probable phosphoglycerate mutase
VTAHCDGGARGNPGPAGYGAVLQDESGRVLAELSEFLGVRTNNYAEYSGLLACLQWALDHKQPRLRVVSDSLLMVRQIQGKYKVNSPDLRPLWEQARRHIAQLDRFEITHALRHKNKDADRLANQAMDRGRAGAPAPPRAAAPGARSSIAPAPPNPATPAPPRAAAASVIETAPLPRGSGEAAQAPRPPSSAPGRGSAVPAMLRGFTRDGAIHLLGGASLPDGVFVKVIPE